MAIIPGIPQQALSRQRGPVFGSPQQAAGLAGLFREQAEQEQMTDIFARNITQGPTGARQLNKPGVLSDLFQVQPGKAVELEQIWTKQAPTGKTPEQIQYQQDLLGFKGRKLESEERMFSKQMAFDEKKLEKSMRNLSTGKMEPEKAVALEGKLRAEFIRANKDTATIGDAYNRILASKAAGVKGTGPSDLSLIFNYMKMLDPNSTVREGEFATAENAGGIAEKVRNSWNRMLQGVRLTPKVRNEFYAHTERLMVSSHIGYNRSRNVYNKMAERYNVDPLNVTINIGRENIENSTAKQTAVPSPDVSESVPEKGPLTEDRKKTLKAKYKF